MRYVGTPVHLDSALSLMIQIGQALWHSSTSMLASKWQQLRAASFKSSNNLQGSKIVTTCYPVFFKTTNKYEK